MMIIVGNDSYDTYYCYHPYIYLTYRNPFIVICIP